MAVLSREDFRERVKKYFGDAPDDDQISFMEDVVDTYEDSVTRSGDMSVREAEWKEKYDNLDREWRRRYTERFYGKGGDPDSANPGNNEPEDAPDHDAEVSEETYLFEDLFKKED